MTNKKRELRPDGNFDEDGSSYPVVDEKIRAARRRGSLLFFGGLVILSLWYFTMGTEPVHLIEGTGEMATVRGNYVPLMLGWLGLMIVISGLWEWAWAKELRDRQKKDAPPWPC